MASQVCRAGPINFEDTPQQRQVHVKLLHAFFEQQDLSLIDVYSRLKSLYLPAIVETLPLFPPFSDGEELFPTNTKLSLAIFMLSIMESNTSKYIYSTCEKRKITSEVCRALQETLFVLHRMSYGEDDPVLQLYQDVLSYARTLEDRICEKIR